MLSIKTVYKKGLESCNDVLEVMEGVDKASFSHDKKTKLAVSMAFSHLSEMCKMVPASVKSQHPHSPWRQIREMRNLITHEYWKIDWNHVWDTTHLAVPVMKTFFEERLRNYELENPEPPKRGPDIPL